MNHKEVVIFWNWKYHLFEQRWAEAVGFCLMGTHTSAVSRKPAHLMSSSEAHQLLHAHQRNLSGPVV